WQQRELLVQCLEAAGQNGDGKDRIDGKCQFGLDIRDDRLGAGLQGCRAFDDTPGIVEDHPSRIVEHRNLAAAVEKRRSERGLERLDRLADCRLDAAKTTRGSGKAASLGDSYQDAHLIESKGIEHRSIALSDE